MPFAASSTRQWTDANVSDRHGTAGLDCHFHRPALERAHAYPHVNQVGLAHYDFLDFCSCLRVYGPGRMAS